MKMADPYFISFVASKATEYLHKRFSSVQDDDDVDDDEEESYNIS